VPAVPVVLLTAASLREKLQGALTRLHALEDAAQHVHASVAVAHSRVGDLAHALAQIGLQAGVLLLPTLEDLLADADLADQLRHGHPQPGLLEHGNCSTEKRLRLTASPRPASSGQCAEKLASSLVRIGQCRSVNVSCRIKPDSFSDDDATPKRHRRTSTSAFR
jgi:hypothetical protein